MNDWNVIVTVNEGHLVDGCELLQSLGELQRTAFHNVIVMRVDDVAQFVESLPHLLTDHLNATEIISRISPVTDMFTFHSVEEFESRAQETLSKRLAELAGKQFHIRMHQRGWRDKLGECNEEAFLGEMVLLELERAGATCEVEFDDPDVIVAVETLDNRAGVSLWTREQLNRFPFLRVD